MRSTATRAETVKIEANPHRAEGVKGSFAVDGAYGRDEFADWAAGFRIDANHPERLPRTP